MRWGITAFLGPFASPEAWLSVAQRTRVDLVELRAEPGFAHPADMPAGHIRHLRRRASEAGVRLSLHAPLHDLNPASSNPEIEAGSWAELSACVGLAAELEAELLVVHPGSVPADHPPSYRLKATARFLYGLHLLADRAAANDVTIALENKQKGTGEDLVRTPDEHLYYLRQVPSLGACLDFGHMHTLEIDPWAYTTALGERLIHVHLHDNTGQHDEHLPLGQGSLDWSRALASLEQTGYKGAVVLELADVAGIQESLACLRAWRRGL